MACRFVLRVVFSLALSVFVLSCSDQAPVEPPPEEAALGEEVAINGELYRRVVAKATADQANDVIVISIPVSTSGGNIIIANEITIAGKTYTADCSANDGPSTQSDDVGNTRSTATSVSLRYNASSANDPAVVATPNYQITAGDVDFFRVRPTKNVNLGVLSAGQTRLYGRLLDSQGRLIVSDIGTISDPNFFLFNGVVAGRTYYVEVRGATSSTRGTYSLGFGTWNPTSGKPVASELNVEEMREEMRENIAAIR